MNRKNKPVENDISLKQQVEKDLKRILDITSKILDDVESELKECRRIMDDTKISNTINKIEIEKIRVI
ncbi:MAG: hypothetical protein Ta2D_07090 [Rickettsiales bacterium]|nr:MAG: hypothetical protein Ta2D_07090 [Rickettsiales bacterium]